MGFFTGFFSGFALTTSVLYISIQIHRSNRHEQRNAIHQQVQALNWISSPIGAYDRRLAVQNPTREEPLKLEPPTMKDTLKHRWNEEVKVLARKVHEGGWEDVRDVAGEGWRAAVRIVKRE